MIKDLKNIVFVLLGISIPISIAATNVLLALFLIFWIIEGGFKKKLIIFKSSKWLWAISSLCLMFCIGFLYGEAHEDASYVLQRIFLLMFFIVFISSDFQNRTFKIAISMFLATNFISACLAIAINNEFISPLHHYISLINEESTLSAFLKYNYHNILLSFSSLLSLALFSRSNSNKKVIYLVLILIYSLSIFSEAGRAGQLTFNLFFLVYFIYFLRIKILYSISILLFLITINYSSYNTSHVFKHRVDTLQHIVENNGEKKNSKNSEKDIRYLFLNEGIKLIAEKPIFGYGTGSFSSVFAKNTNSNYNFIKHKTPHNNFLYILFEIGLFGLLIFLAIFYFQIKSLLVSKNINFHLIILPLFYLFLMLFDSYLFIYTITVFYIFMFTIYYKVKDLEEIVN